VIDKRRLDRAERHLRDTIKRERPTYYDATMLRHALVKMYGWSYREANEMDLRDAQSALLLGRNRNTTTVQHNAKTRRRPRA